MSTMEESKVEEKQDAKQTKPEDNSMSTFKTPSFIIPSKKKVQSTTSTAGMFKSPDKISKSYLPVNNLDRNEEQSADIKNPSVGEEISKHKDDVKDETMKEVKDKTIADTTDETMKKTMEEVKDKTIADITDETMKKPMGEVENGKNIEEATIIKVPVNKAIVLSPAEQLKQSQAAVPYKEPSWGAICEEKFAFEVIKNGSVVDNIDLTKKSFYVIGRLPSCDVPMEHPSLSRHHAVLQYSCGKSEQYPKGWYLFDLDSTHGTWINKNKVPPQKFHRIHVDYVLKFGGSTRLFILQGPDTDREDESELSVSEMKEQREKQKKELELLRLAEEEEAEKMAEAIKQREEAKGCSWGIDEEEVEEEDENSENPFAAIEPENEDLYINDPKKSLNGYFEREGLDLPEYDFHEAGFGKWKCSVELPIDASNGEPMVAEVVVSGKKKDAVIACALEACRILDRHGELRKSNKESRKRKGKNWEDDDFYDSDEDVYLDRTGAIEKKRQLRKGKVGKVDTNAETYDTLLEKHKKVSAEIEEIEGKLEQAKAQAAAMESEEVDALDAYMSAIKSGMMDTKTKIKLKTQLIELRQEEQKLRKLVNIAKPASLPEMKPKTVTGEVKKTGVLASVGKMKGSVHSKISKKVVPDQKQKPTKTESDESEHEEDEENEPNSQDSKSVPNDQHSSSDSLLDTVKVTSSAEKNHVKSSDAVSKSKVKGPAMPENAGKKTVKEENVSKTTSRMKGPTLPLAAVLEKLQEEAEDLKEDRADGSDDKTVKNSGKRKSNSETTKHKKLKVGDEGYTEDDPDYAVWLPPENQSGDGKTHLNAKLGY